ncbi:hypothetical protein EniLVp02_0005 [Vibrio phage EniLVp02]
MTTQNSNDPVLLQDRFKDGAAPGDIVLTTNGGLAIIDTVMDKQRGTAFYLNEQGEIDRIPSRRIDAAGFYTMNSLNMLHDRLLSFMPSAEVRARIDKIRRDNDARQAGDIDRQRYMVSMVVDRQLVEKTAKEAPGLLIIQKVNSTITTLADRRVAARVVSKFVEQQGYDRKYDRVFGIRPSPYLHDYHRGDRYSAGRNKAVHTAVDYAQMMGMYSGVIKPRSPDSPRYTRDRIDVTTFGTRDPSPSWTYSTIMKKLNLDVDDFHRAMENGDLYTIPFMHPKDLVPVIGDFIIIADAVY